MPGNKKTSWENDFKEFLAIQPSSVPSALSERVLTQIHQELNPGSLKVFVKVSFIQFAVGLFTLLFCPQFGISFTSGMGLMPYLMKFGEGICMLGCGALFTSLSLIIVSFGLKPEEIRTLKQHEFLQLASLATLSLGAFLCLGGEVVFTLGLVWLIGAVTGGVITLELGWALRRKIAQRAFA
jgi:hypothetical protein